MAERQPGWKQALNEPNAAGWIGLIILVLVIGFGTLYFGGGKTDPTAQTTDGSQTAK